MFCHCQTCRQKSKYENYSKRLTFLLQKHFLDFFCFAFFPQKMHWQKREQCVTVPLYFMMLLQ